MKSEIKIKIKSGTFNELVIIFYLNVMNIYIYPHYSMNLLHISKTICNLMKKTMKVNLPKNMFIL